MTVVFLTSASVSPWGLPGDWTNAGHQIEIVGCGGQAGAATSGTGGDGGGGGGGGAYTKLVSPSGSLGSTTPFQVVANNTSTANGTGSASIWEATAVSNSYYAEAGLAGSANTGGVGGVSNTNGSPSPVTYTRTGNSGGTGGGTSLPVIGGGGGGGGAGGPAAAGGSGGAGSTTAGGGGGGGGAANNGATGNG